MSYNPSLSYFLSRLQGVSTNYFRLEPQSSGSSTITANKIIRFSLPSNCLLNTRGISFNFNADANALASAGGRLPADISSLIDRVELSSGGVQIAQGANGYGLITAMKRAMTCDKCDPALGHPEIVRTRSYVDGAGDYATGSTSAILTTKNENYRNDAGQTQFAVNNWEGFLGSVQPAIIDTSLLSDLTLTLYLADNSVCSSSAGPALPSTATTGIDVANTIQAQYQLKDFHLIVETLGMADSVYDMMIEKRISQVGYIELPFKSYYTFNDTHSGTTRFTVATQSLDRVWVGMRATTYADIAGVVKVAGYKDKGAFTGLTLNAATTDGSDVGLPAYDAGGSGMLGNNTEKYRGNYFNFVEAQASAGVPATYQFNFNGSFIPQFKATSEQMLTVSRNSVPTNDMKMGEYPLSVMCLDQYKKNFFIQCVRLNLPQAEENREICGADTRGISLNAYFTSTGVTSGKNIFIACECSSSLRIGAGRAIEVIA